MPMHEKYCMLLSERFTKINSLYVYIESHTLKRMAFLLKKK
jgi:hypothetical protein